MNPIRSPRISVCPANRFQPLAGAPATAPSRGRAEGVLRDLAFVYHVTNRVRQAMSAEKPALAFAR